MTSPSDHARVRITNPIVIARMPASQPSSACLSVRMRCVTASPIATRQPASEPHRIALNGSAAPNVSQSEAGPTAPRPSKYSPKRTVRTTVSTGIAALYQRRGTPSGASSPVSSEFTINCDPGRKTPPPVRVLVSAPCMGPKSRCDTITAATMNRARMG